MRIVFEIGAERIELSTPCLKDRTADTSNAAVLTRINTTRETPAKLVGSHAHYVATFKAQKSGEATIKMSAVAHCEAMNPAFCTQPSGAMTITVS